MKNEKALYDALCKQLDNSKKLLSLENDKTAVLLRGDINALDEIVRGEQAFIMKIESLNKKRQLFLSDEGYENSTVGELIEKYLSAEYAVKYTLLHKEFCVVTDELKKVNKLNQRLLKERLNLLGMMERLLV